MFACTKSGLFSLGFVDVLSGDIQRLLFVVDTATLLMPLQRSAGRLGRVECSLHIRLYLPNEALLNPLHCRALEWMSIAAQLRYAEDRGETQMRTRWFQSDFGSTRKSSASQFVKLLFKSSTFTAFKDVEFCSALQILLNRLVPNLQGQLRLR